MNVIIVTNKGIMQKPLLIRSNSNADAIYENICEKMLGEDFKDIFGCFASDMTYDRVNKYLSDENSSIQYFTDIKSE
jgi:hypothetical protein